MIDDLDQSISTLRLLVSEALKSWPTPAILKLLEESDVIVRTASARELQVRGTRDIYNHAVALSESNLADLREIAAFILGQLGTPEYPFSKESFPIVLRLSRDSVADVRSAAAAALGWLCSGSMPDEVEERLISLCSDADKDVRACAASALGSSSGSPQVRQALNGLIKQEYVGPYAELGLEILDGKES